ncbi:MAG: polyphosphate polymerase domain-containing protein [Eubacteriales bacterium]|nr:polyphosphate polymerase domain-containing protein [Eubacteriales bacterium]
MKFRHEYKHRINYLDVMQLKNRLGIICPHDSHCTADGTYIVRSLYFDNYMDKALKEKVDGVNKREKFRIRYYGDDTSFIRLEKKSKINGMCHKEHIRITKEECEMIIGGDIDFLIKSDDNLKRELYAKMKYQLLRPKLIIAYRRECFVYPPGNVRITLDSEISGSSNVFEFLNPQLKYTQYCTDTILEVKWDEYIPDIISSAVQSCDRKAGAFSKYEAVRF